MISEPKGIIILSTLNRSDQRRLHKKLYNYSVFNKGLPLPYPSAFHPFTHPPSFPTITLKKYISIDTFPRIVSITCGLNGKLPLPLLFLSTALNSPSPPPPLSLSFSSTKSKIQANEADARVDRDPRRPHFFIAKASNFNGSFFFSKD